MKMLKLLNLLDRIDKLTESCRKMSLDAIKQRNRLLDEALEVINWKY